MGKLKLTTRQVTKLSATLELRQELKDQMAVMKKQLTEIDAGLRAQIDSHGWTSVDKDKKKSQILEVGETQLVLTHATRRTLDRDLLLANGVLPTVIAESYKDTAFTQLRTRAIPDEEG